MPVSAWLSADQHLGGSVVNVMVSYDSDADATCVKVTDAAVASTDSLADLLAVDLDVVGDPVGIEVMKAPWCRDRQRRGDRAGPAPRFATGLRVSPPRCCAACLILGADRMQTPQRRDQKTVVIATALGLFVLVVAAGAGLLWVTDSVFGWPGEDTNAVFSMLVVAAGAAAVVHLVRADKR